MYTTGKTRAQAHQKQTPCHGKRRGGGRQRSRFQYSYADLFCGFCLHHKQYPFALCPYILENLDDLLCDAAFISAIESAEPCADTHGHKEALLYLRKMNAVPAGSGC